MDQVLLADNAPQICLPDWLVRWPQDVAFASGAALALVHLVQAELALPQALWRARLALLGAQNAAGLSGRPISEADLRDALCLLRPGDHPGPVGDIALVCSRLVARRISVAAMARALPRVPAALWAAPRLSSPVAQAAQMLGDALDYTPRDRVTALALADAGLARALGWDHVVPLLAMGMAVRDLRGGHLDAASLERCLSSCAGAFSEASAGAWVRADTTRSGPARGCP